MDGCPPRRGGSSWRARSFCSDAQRGRPGEPGVDPRVVVGLPRLLLLVVLMVMVVVVVPVLPAACVSTCAAARFFRRCFALSTSICCCLHSSLQNGVSPLHTQTTKPL